MLNQFNFCNRSFGQGCILKIIIIFHDSFLFSLRNLKYLKVSYYIISSFGMGVGERRNVPPPQKSEKLLQKSGVILQRSILWERSQKSKKQLVKNYEKVNFTQRFSSENLKIFLRFFKFFFNSHSLSNQIFFQQSFSI